jgi:hypothetical protein
VIAEVGLDRADDVARLCGEHRVLERLHHRAPRERAKVAALRRRAGILRVRLRELAELRGIGLRLREQRLRLFLRRCLLVVRRVGLDRDQDVRSLAFLLRRVLLRIGVVRRLDFGGLD